MLGAARTPRRRTQASAACSAAGAFLVADGRPDDVQESHISEPRINDRIRVSEVRLVGPAGEQVGIVRVEDALRLAQEADLDLVEVAPDARPPVCKLMDYGKFKYEADMKAREARRNQANTVLKEIRFRLKIDPHDYGTKKGHVERFLKAGDKVKVMIMFRGREQSRPEMGVRLLQRLADDVAELGTIESMPRQDGRNMIMVLGPTKKKADVKNEQRRRAREAEARQAARRTARPTPAARPRSRSRRPRLRPAGRATAGCAPRPRRWSSRSLRPRPRPRPAGRAEPAEPLRPRPRLRRPASSRSLLRAKAAPVAERSLRRRKPASAKPASAKPAPQACCRQARCRAQADPGHRQACGAGRRSPRPGPAPRRADPTRAARRVA